MPPGVVATREASSHRLWLTRSAGVLFALAAVLHLFEPQPATDETLFAFVRRLEPGSWVFAVRYAVDAVTSVAMAVIMWRLSVVFEAPWQRVAAAVVGAGASAIGALVYAAQPAWGLWCGEGCPESRA